MALRWFNLIAIDEKQLTYVIKLMHIKAYSSGERLGRAFSLLSLVRIFLNFSMLIFSARNFSVEQTVTAGNGISEINVDLSLNVTVTGCWCQFVQMFEIATLHKITDAVHTIAHHNLCKNSPLNSCYITKNPNEMNLPFEPMKILFREVSHSMHCRIGTKVLDNIKCGLLKRVEITLWIRIRIWCTDAVFRQRFT